MYDINDAESYQRNINNGERLNYFRISNNVKAKDLARTLGISWTSYYYYERGERPIPDKIVETLNLLYGLELEYTGNKPIIPVFNQKLKQLRLRDDISQSNFADILNVKTKFIQEIESGKKDITLTIDFLTRLQKCNYDLNWLFDDKI